MRTRIRACVALAALAYAASAAGGLLTIEQAVSLSQKTGRPIFAVAGSPT